MREMNLEDLEREERNWENEIFLRKFRIKEINNDRVEISSLRIKYSIG